MSCDKHRLVFFDAIDGTVLKLVQRERVLLCFDLGAYKVCLAVIASWIDRLVHTIFVRDALNLVVIRVVSEFSNASNFSTLIFLIFILFISLNCSFLSTMLSLYLSENSCTFSRQLIILLLQEIIVIACQVLNLHVNLLIFVVIIFDHLLLVVLRLLHLFSFLGCSSAGLLLSTVGTAVIVASRSLVC